MTEELSINLDSIVIPTSSSKVFKDDCMFSFDTAFDPNGLDICMTCHQAFSRGEFKYTQMHSEFYNHDIFLNYKKIRKINNKCEIENDEQPKKMIKLEIKETLESDLFDIKCSIYFQKLNKSIEYPNNELPLKVSQAVESILNSTSSEKKEEISSWELEIKPCKHSLNLIQNPISNLQLKKCNNCELNENLWICLHCGNLGCGRSQFGGVPGNSHAMLHEKENSDHCIAVKLGSLSTDIADCYCYSCDEEIKVPNLSKLLKTFGIDITKFIRTEKSLTELQIEQNIQWDFKMTVGNNNEELKPIFGKGLTGFKNLGNSCYLASVLQILFSLKSFKDAFFNLNGIPLDKILGNFKPYEDIETQLFKIGDGLLSGRYSKPDNFTTETIKYQHGIKPSGFKKLIGEGHNEFSTMLQQDAFEFWGYLIDKLEKKKIYGQLNNSPTDSLKFILENKIKCKNCNFVRIKNEITDFINIPININLLEKDINGNEIYEETTVNESIKSWKLPEIFEYSCPKCGNLQEAIKEVGFKTNPQYLVINPQRIILKNWVPTKVTVPIKFDETLSLKDFKGNGLLSGEEEFIDEEGEGEEITNEPQFDQNVINSLFEMGFTENRVKHALFATGNKGAEIAMNWLFEHIEDPNIDKPFKASINVNKKENNFVDSEKLESLSNMGFTELISKKALILNNGNVEAAVEWLFNNPDDDGVIEVDESNNDNNDNYNDVLLKKLEQENDSSDEYQLIGIICHKGTSVHSGHYVAFIKKEVEIDGNKEKRWVLFNDEKVVLAVKENMKEVESSGYLYIYERI